jgi:hypothetical protein
MMDRLAAGILEKVKAEFQGMDLKKAPQEEGAAGPSQGRAPGEKKKSWYAVINGKGGVNSVFPNWIGGAAPYVTGTSGALTKKFDSFESAWKHVSDHLAIEEALKKAEEEEIHKAMGANLLDTQTKPTARGTYPRPPLGLLGPDESLKKEDAAFGFDFGSEFEVVKNSSPPGLSHTYGRAMTNAVTDVVALPGGFKGGGDHEGGSDLAMMSMALEELVHQGRSVEGGGDSMKSDLQWRMEKRTALRTITSTVKLTKRLKDLLKIRDRVLKNMMRATTNVLKKAGWNDPEAIVAWASGGYLTKLVRDSMDAWIALHQHFLGLATTENVPWSYVQVEIDHHVEELDIIRHTQDSRIQALFAIYAYLRDGHSSSWHSTSLQYKRNTEIYTRVADADEYCKPLVEGAYSKSFPGCIHCGTLLHSGGKAQCPWKKFSKKKAKLKANAAFLIVAEEQGTPSDEEE